ncbi:hypothetical protein Scinn_67250 [Streptomyces virginiae]|uniref:Uncharacterized protein n=1 Tax=Streptomyces virginiae TaxID=1961 RepID=A0ABQ3NWW2_STRVG|nr:hypothetical protein Scinn_67250 [Streptomyces virginiae]
MDLLLEASVHLVEMRLLDRDLPIADGIRRVVDSGILRGHQGPLLTCMGDRQPYANRPPVRTLVPERVSLSDTPATGIRTP